MFFIPLSQSESVDLLIHALRAAGGEADCSICPVRKVCSRQCLAIAASIEEMARNGSLPAIELDEAVEVPSEHPEPKPAAKLKVVK